MKMIGSKPHSKATVNSTVVPMTVSSHIDVAVWIRTVAHLGSFWRERRSRSGRKRRVRVSRGHFPSVAQVESRVIGGFDFVLLRELAPIAHD